MSRLRYLFLGLFCALSFFGFAQQAKQEELAASYFQSGEFDKAIDMYSDLLQNNPNSHYFYTNLLESYLRSGRLDDAEKMLRKQIRKEHISYAAVDLFYVYKQLHKPEKADEIWKQLIEKMPDHPETVIEWSNAFVRRNEKNKAIDLLEKARVFYRSPTLFSEELGTLYGSIGQISEMIREYLNWLSVEEDRLDDIQGLLQGYLNKASDFEMLKSALLKELRTHPENDVYYEMLVWMYVQKKDFKNAYTQVNTLDKRQHKNGRRILQLGNMALENTAFSDAVFIYSQLVNQGAQAMFYYEARQALLTARRMLVYSGDSVSIADLQALEQAYLQEIHEQPNPHAQRVLQKDLAGLLALYLHRYDSAIVIYNDIIQSRDPDRRFIASCKLDCADIYVLKGEVWDAMLLYGQVDKDFLEEPEGQEAKYRNARLSYFVGELDWAKSQLDVLKTASTQLIANNALELSLLIQDNTADSIQEPLKMFARADLFYLQHDYMHALKTLDSIALAYPQNSLADDILYKKAQIHRDLKHYDEAIRLYDEVISRFGQDLYGDNALFEKAEMYRLQIHDLSKAKEAYGLFIERYSGSFLLEEARKQYRLLRGDNLN